MFLGDTKKQWTATSCDHQNYWSWQLVMFENKSFCISLNIAYYRISRLINKMQRLTDFCQVMHGHKFNEIKSRSITQVTCQCPYQTSIYTLSFVLLVVKFPIWLCCAPLVKWFLTLLVFHLLACVFFPAVLCWALSGTAESPSNIK